MTCPKCGGLCTTNKSVGHLSSAPYRCMECGKAVHDD